MEGLDMAKGQAKLTRMVGYTGVAHAAHVHYQVIWLAMSTLLPNRHTRCVVLLGVSRMRKTFVHNNVRHIITSSTHTTMLATAREGKYDTFSLVLSSVKEEIEIHSVEVQEEHGEKVAALGSQRKAIDKEMMRLMGLIK